MTTPPVKSTVSTCSLNKVSAPWDFQSQAAGSLFALGETAKQFYLFYKTEIRARHTNQFIFVFERLMNHVRDSDTDNMLFDSLSGNAHGLLYARMKEHQANAPEKWSEHSKNRAENRTLTLSFSGALGEPRGVVY